MKKRKIVTIILCLTFLSVSYCIWNLYNISAPDKAKPQIQTLFYTIGMKNLPDGYAEG